MSLESEVASLTTATTNLLTAVNVSKATVDQAVIDAAASASLAEDQVALAAGHAATANTKAGEASTSASTAQTAANNAVAVVTGGTASLTPSSGKIPIADDNGKIDADWLKNNSDPGFITQLMVAAEYATDMALLGVREGQRAEATLTTRANTVDATVATYDSAIENQLLGAVRHLLDQSGMNAKTLAETPRLRAAPASASAAGTQGEWAWDSSYIYICTALNTWKRVAISTW